MKQISDYIRERLFPIPECEEPHSQGHTTKTVILFTFTFSDRIRLLLTGRMVVVMKAHNFRAVDIQIPTARAYPVMSFKEFTREPTRFV